MGPRFVMAPVIGPMKNRVSSEVERAARQYAARGWSVVVAEARGKRPLVPWQEFQQRIAAADEIAAWFRRWPRANVAIVTGAVSGLVVLDVDPRHGGADSVARLQQAHGGFPRTLEVRTGGGGRHLYFAHPGGTMRNRVGLAPGVDLRGDGGCVIAPPSVHPNGECYAWVGEGEPDATVPAPLPVWLRAWLRDEPGHAGHPAAHWRELAQGGVREGMRNDTIASFTGHLLWRGVDPVVVRELMLAWNRLRCDPPLRDDEVARTVESIVRLHERDSFGPEPGGPPAVDSGERSA
jgi:hypothetical protein